MTTLNPQDAIHKSWLLKLLIGIIDNPELGENLRFKGGTCASMLGYLDRFSVDLDFDIVNESRIDEFRLNLEKIFRDLNLEIKDQSPRVLEYTLKYPAPINARNTLRLDALGINYKENVYEKVFLPEVGRYFSCQTVETMFAHKLVALMERYARRKIIAGRDIYDIHYFFYTGRRYRPELILERTGKKARDFFNDLKKFVEKRVTTELLVRDLGVLLTADKMRFVKNHLLWETKVFINDELARLV